MKTTWWTFTWNFHIVNVQLMFINHSHTWRISHIDDLCWPIGVYVCVYRYMCESYEMKAPMPAQYLACKKFKKLNIKIEVVDYDT